MSYDQQVLPNEDPSASRIGQDADGPPHRPQTLVAWSSGKDSAWALHEVCKRADLDVVGLLTTFNGKADRVSMQGVRRELVSAQAERLALPMWSVDLPWPCPSEEYERRMGAVMDRARDEGITRVVFGDLFLQDVRDYRAEKLAGTCIEPVFPIWCGASGTEVLANRMIEEGVRAVVTAVDPQQLSAEFAGRAFDAELLADLPSGVDPLGENGEFHTFCYAGPMFDRPIECSVGEVVERNGFIYADVFLV